MFVARHLTQPGRIILAPDYPTLQARIRHAGGYIVREGVDEVILFDDFPQSTGRAKVEIPPLHPDMFSRR